MTKLSDEQQKVLERALSTSTTSEMIEALQQFEQTLAKHSQSKREEIAAILIEELGRTAEHHAQKISRLLAALASVDTPNAAEVVARYAASKPQEIGDRILISALKSLTRMTSYEDKGGLLRGILTKNNSNSRIKAWVLRLLIQYSDESESQNEYVEQLFSMGWDGNADHRWAVLRALRNDPGLNPLPAEVELRIINELAGLCLKDDFEWRDVRVQAALVLGDIREHLRDALDLLATTFQYSSDATLRRYYIESILNLVEQMDKKQRDASPFNTVMLKGLEDENGDVRSRACGALRTVLGPKAATELVVNTLLQQVSLSSRLVEALRHIDDKRATMVLQENLFHPNPEVGQRASEALLELGGDQAFRTLFAQRRQAIDQYTDILNDADERIMTQYNALMCQAHWAFGISMVMHIVIFLLGIGILVMTIYLNSGTPSDALAYLQGFLGTTSGLAATYLGLFYRDPIDNIGNSVTRLVKVNVAFLGYMRQINQIDATFKQLFLDTSGFTLEEMKETVNQINKVVDQSLNKIQTYLTIDESSPSDKTTKQLMSEEPITQPVSTVSASAP